MTEPDAYQKHENVEIKRLGRNGYLHRIVPILDASGKVIERVVRPLMVEFHGKDVVQIIIGSALLAIPAAYTAETWELGEQLPVLNVALVALLSLSFIAIFVYYNFYRGYFRGFGFEYVKRVAATYAITLVVVGLMLTVIDKCPWGVDNLLAIKRIVLVAFPASMSATVADALK